MAELNRISEHGERKLKMRRESMAVSPPPMDGAAREQSRGSPVNGGIDGAQMDGVHGEPDGLPDGVDGVANGRA